MSQENVEVMRAAVERFNRGGEDDALLDEFYSPRRFITRVRTSLIRASTEDATPSED